ncbi:DEAD/DEAH box helicase [Arsenophonus endosymbiont of Crataerina pallida]|uniref:DEAD/DEAH box helicase n=1 Tax=Arsenophonus endosymbiont of Crataerina pallida TaxID=3066235 RepID=UPI0030D58239
MVLNPKTLRYVRREDGREIEVNLDEVRRLGETDAGFRRSIVTSIESLNTIVDASIRELQKRRKETGDNRLKIIASTLNYEHCRQIVEAYRARSLKADYVHSLEEGRANLRVFEKLEAHQLDVIVQVKKLGEGYDHPFLSVAVVFSIFSNLPPFVQFVGRIMRVIEQNAPKHPLNYGTVIFHSGANIAKRWKDFQNYSEADKDFFDQLLPLEDLDFESGYDLEIKPKPRELDGTSGFNVEGQTDVELQEIPLIQDNPEAFAALKILHSAGYSSEQIKQELDKLDPVPVTKVRQRQAMRASLDQRVKTAVGRILGEQGLNPEGHHLDRSYFGRNNFVILKTVIDRKINDFVGRKNQSRDDFTGIEFEQIMANFNDFLKQSVEEVFNG